jgi:signal transduction histidine kinase
MNRLVQGILLVSRDGQRRLAPEPVDLAELVAGVGASLARQLDAAGAALEIDAAITLTADRLALEQVLGNLADNAVKYLDPARPGRVRISARRESGCVVVAVADNGRGIAPEDRARVFEMFRRAGPQDTAGEGIGLAHVVVLVRRMRGRLDLESSPGVGSTFTVTLPE